MIAGYRLLLRDPTLWCVSAWNDNGKPAFVADNTRIFRSDFFGGLGWMLQRQTWEEVRFADVCIADSVGGCREGLEGGAGMQNNGYT